MATEKTEVVVVCVMCVCWGTGSYKEMLSEVVIFYYKSW